MLGVTFGDKHSFRDWKLITKTRPVISPPNPKTLYVDIPEVDGQLDLTESLSEDVKFENRTITCEFAVIESRKRWSTIYSQIMNYLHGKKMRIVFDDDPNHYYIGRLQVDEWQSEKRTSTIVISGTVEPYKHDMYSSIEAWKWDDFNFESDIIREYRDVYVNNSLTMVIYGSRKPSIPEFIVNSILSSTMTLTFDAVSYTLHTGRNRFPEIILKDGENILTFNGRGTINIDYRGGSL